MRTTLTTVLIGVLILGGLSTVASAAPKHDEFIIVLFEDNGIWPGSTPGGTGWNNGQWVPYPSGWWNQWFYNDPPDPTRWKEIDYSINVSADVGPGSELMIAINWSTMEYPENPNQPPIPPIDEALTIYRETIYQGPADNPMFSEPLTGHITIRDYNPEWVSIDVQGYLGVNGGAQISGWIDHECIPEPMTLSLLALGGVAVLIRRRP